MSEPRAITRAGLESLLEALLRDGVRVVAPRRRAGRLELGELRSSAEWDAGPGQSVSSAKAVAFPRVEKILGYRRRGSDVELEDPEPPATETVVIGIRPCEARAFAALDAVLGRDAPDPFFPARLARTTLVSLACTEADEACFCTSLGGGPADASGSDALLRPLADGSLRLETPSEKGRALFARAGELPRADPAAPLAPVAALSPAFDAAALREALGRRFDDDVWQEQSLRCLGCGACAFVCPACACFDIQDEPGRDGAGRRLRCWDSCGLRSFTLHASGHNPRDRQGQRWRQRVYHKFAYLPARSGTSGCVGCGKCTRACPVDMNLGQHLAQLAGGAS